MALSGKLIGHVEISKKGDVFHDLFLHNPHNIAAISPDKVHDCELHVGERGVVGSVICWQYTHEESSAANSNLIANVRTRVISTRGIFSLNKEGAICHVSQSRRSSRSQSDLSFQFELDPSFIMIIEAVNEANQMIVFKVIGGDLVEEIYKAFTIILHVEEKGDKQVATWTFVFEKPDTSVPYPTSLMDYLCNLVKDLDAHNATN